MELPLLITVILMALTAQYPDEMFTLYGLIVLRIVYSWVRRQHWGL